MQQYKEAFDTYMGIKGYPNTHEKALFDRAKDYIGKIEDVPGIEMIAVCNSLSMFATHQDSDIDLFIVTKSGMLWFVRFFVTLRFWKLKVWRKGEDIAGNFCLSFFITTNALDLSKIAIENDIYLHYWIYYLKPILHRNNTYEEFLDANTWVKISPEQKDKNLAFTMPTKSQIQPEALQRFYYFLNDAIRFFLQPKTLKNYERLGRPRGVIISDDILKFHTQDERQNIRDALLEKSTGESLENRENSSIISMIN